MTAAFFDRMAATYDALWTTTPIGRAQRHLRPTHEEADRRGAQEHGDHQRRAGWPHPHGDLRQSWPVLPNCAGEAHPVVVRTEPGPRVLARLQQGLPPPQAGPVTWEWLVPGRVRWRRYVHCRG